MAIDHGLIDELSTLLLASEESCKDRSPLTDDWPQLDVESAYLVQDNALAKRLARNERLVGIKLGLTSRAKQQRMGIDSPLTAWLTDGMALPAGAPVPQHALIHPRVEPEVIFTLGEQLRGPGITAARALAAVDSVYGGLEIIDSRFRDFRFTLPDVIADNASAGRFVLGPVARRPDQLDLSLEACVLQVNGTVVDTATGAAVQGHPAEALALAANALGRRGLALEAGWIVLTGGMTDAVTVGRSTTVTAEFTHLGIVTLSGGH